MSNEVPRQILEPLSLDEFLQLINVIFKLYGRNVAQKEFEKYKHLYYNVTTDDGEAEDEENFARILKYRPTLFY